MKEFFKSIPGLRPTYRAFRKLLLNVTRPILKVLACFHGYGYYDRNLITNRNTDFLTKAKFSKAAEIAIQKSGKDLSPWVLHTVNWASQHALTLDGDFVECGVHTGCFAHSTMNYIDFKNCLNKKYYLFDTFKGLSPKYSTSEELAAYEKSYEVDVYEKVCEDFSDYNNVTIIRGVVPDSFKDVNIEKVAYLSIDLNSVIPEIESIKFFWDKLVFGGVVILDDYAQPGRHHLQKKAFDEFAASKGAEILSLPTGQGLLIKN